MPSASLPALNPSPFVTQSGEFFDRCPLMRGKWDRVYAQGRCDLRVPQLRLRILRRTTRQLQQSGMGAPERVPTDPGQADLPLCGFELPQQQIGIAEGSAFARGENEPLSLESAWTLGARSQRDDQCSRQGKRSFAGFGFGRAEATAINGLFYPQLAFVEIEVLPAQAQNLPNSQTGQNREQNHGANRLPEMAEQERNLLRREYTFFAFGIFSGSSTPEAGFSPPKCPHFLAQAKIFDIKLRR